MQVVGLGAATASISAIAQLSDQKSASLGNFVGGIGVLAAITAALAGVYMQSPQAVTIEVRMYVYVCMKEYMYVCMHVCMYVCMYVYVSMCMHFAFFVAYCMYASTYYLCMYVSLYVCMYVGLSAGGFGSSGFCGSGANHRR